jgi:serine/threonine-protein kinase
MLRAVQPPVDSLPSPADSREFPLVERLEPLRPEAGAAQATTWDSREAVRAAAHRELHHDLLEQGVGRLFGITGLSSLIFAGYLFYLLAVVPRAEPQWGHFVALLGTGLGLSLATLCVVKWSGIRPHIARDLGYVYLVALSFVLGLMRHSPVWPSSTLLSQVSPLVVPILAFAALIPAAPRMALATSVGAAAMDPLAMFILRGNHAVPPAREVVLLLASPFLAALVGYHISRVVHRLSESIVNAREIGSYRLLKRLGKGGMAEVWRAEHRMLVRPAAVKLIRPEVIIGHGPVASERLVRLFLREARTTAQLSSPNTIQLYDFGVTREGAFYYVMELLDGIDLQQLVERFGPQTPERTAHLLRQVCRSLGEAHAADFVHRDVKPANVFTCLYGGEADFVKVLDFGLVLDRHPTPEEIDDEQRFVGTPAVMAPEMVRFQAPVDARADIYAAGCIGYWLLTGRHVFEAQTRHDMLVMHAHQKPQLPSKRLGAPLHDGLEALIMQCLEKNPDKRPQTARELGEGLAALTFSQPWTEERAELWWKRYSPTSNAPTEPRERTESSEPPAAAPVDH